MNKFKYEVGTTITLREKSFYIFERYDLDGENYYGCRLTGTLYDYSNTEEYLDHAGYPPEKPEINELPMGDSDRDIRFLYVQDDDIPEPNMRELDREQMEELWVFLGEKLGK